MFCVVLMIRAQDVAVTFAIAILFMCCVRRVTFAADAAVKCAIALLSFLE